MPCRDSNSFPTNFTSDGVTTVVLKPESVMLVHNCVWCRQQRLQFRPPFEEIKAKYFREMKKFISIPKYFRGTGESTENLVFPAMIERNAEGFVTCYRKANILFHQLAAVLDQFRVRTGFYQCLKCIIRHLILNIIMWIVLYYNLTSILSHCSTLTVNWSE